MSFFSKNFIPKEKSARKAFCYSSVYYATSRGKVGSNHFFGKVLIHEQVCHQTFRAPTSPPSPTSSSSSSLPSILHHFAQIINRKTRQHCGSHIYSDERKRRCEGTPKGPSYNFVLKLNITPGQGVSIFIFRRVFFIMFYLNPISHWAPKVHFIFIVFPTAPIHNCNQQTKENFEISFAPGLTEFQGNLKGGRSITSLRIFFRSGGGGQGMPKSLSVKGP